MTILLQHSQKQYVSKDCKKGFCEDKTGATKFKTIFSAMKYLISQNEETIKQYKFVEQDEITQVKDGHTETNSNGRRRRSI